jgi:hypothetical protein
MKNHLISFRRRAVAGFLVCLCCAAASGCGGGMRYEKFTAKDPDLGISVDHIAGWLVLETKGSKKSYSDVNFTTPANARALMSVTSLPLKKGSETPPAYADELLSKRKRLPHFNLDSRKDLQVAGKPGIELTMSYDKPADIYSTKDELIAVREKLAIFSDGTKLYVVKYTNINSDFASYDKGYEHMLSTLKLLH